MNLLYPCPNCKTEHDFEVGWRAYNGSFIGKVLRGPDQCDECSEPIVIFDDEAVVLAAEEEWDDAA